MKKTILALALILALLLSGCGQNFEKEGGYDSYGSYESYDYELPAEAEEFSTASTENGGEELAEPAAETAEKIIYTADLTMETTAFEETVASLEKTVRELGGFTQDSSVSGDTDYSADGSVRVINRYAYYTVRIPSAKLDEFLAQTGELGNVTYSNKSAVNVTAAYTDYERRQASLEVEEARLLELIARAEEIEDLITLEDKLSDVRYEIESLQGSLRELDQKVAYSTVDISISEVSGYRSPASVNRSFFERLGDAFVGGLADVADFLGDFAVGIAGAIIPLAILAGVIVWIVKAVKRRKKKAAAPQTEAEKSE